MRDAMRGYLNAASGLTELTRKRAQDLAQSLLSATGTGGSGAAVAHQVTALAEELVTAARSNRHAVQEMIRGEVEMAVGRLGLVPASELAAARKQIAQLESAVAELRRGAVAAPGSATASRSAAGAAATRSRPPRAAVKKAAASNVAVKKATPKASVKKAAASKVPAPKATARSAAAEKATLRPAAARKATIRPSEPTS